jgi:N utilization substance protein A
MHDKVRAYVMEVRRTNRGPQIVVSRTHRGMLRRLLEYEVPEIYNGTVEIKSIAREPGARSKVAVAALQPGADPVGACVGMRGVRIQSIVKELNNEKIDVIEWSPDQSVFISKALSPARVNSVFLDDDPESGKTATVVVPDDQLSLAIGRAGQNARLAAKLTGWRIDIKSVTEAAQEAYQHIQEEEELAELHEENLETIEKVGQIMEKKAENRPVMPEEYAVLTRFVDLVESQRSAIREERRAEMRAQIAEAKQQVPDIAYQHPLEDTDLPLRVYNLLDEAGYQTVGEVMEQYHYNPDRFLNISGFGPAALEDIETMIDTIEFPEPEVEEVDEAEAVAEAEIEAEAEAETEEAEGEVEVEPAAEGAAEPVAEVEVPEDKLIDEEAYERARRAALVADLTSSQPSEEAEEVEEPEEQPVEAPAAEAPVVEDEVEEEAPEEVVEVEPEEEEEEPEEETPYRPEPTLEELYEEDVDEETARERARQRRRQLVYDEEAGRVISKRRRKGGRKREKWMEQWEEYEDE